MLCISSFRRCAFWRSRIGITAPFIAARVMVLDDTRKTPAHTKYDGSNFYPTSYAAMHFEGLVGVMALIAASALHPGDYFAINTSPAVFQTLGLSTVNLADLSRQVAETVIGRTGGGVSLAVGSPNLRA